MSDQRDVHLRKLRRCALDIEGLEAKLAAARTARDLALREAVDAGVRIADAAPECGLTFSSARFVLYQKDKRASAKS